MSSELALQVPPQVLKDKQVAFSTHTGKTSYKHAALDNASELIGAALAIHGISHRWNVEQEERVRKEAEEARLREIQRQRDELLDAQTMLRTFKRRFGHMDEFASIIAAVDRYLENLDRIAA